MEIHRWSAIEQSKDARVKCVVKLRPRARNCCHRTADAHCENKPTSAVSRMQFPTLHVLRLLVL